MSRTLFERLRGPPGRATREDQQTSSLPSVRAEREEAALQGSICENLRHLLNSHLDMADCSPDYGLPDVADIVRSMPQSSSAIRTSLQKCIERYEPRLRDVRVTLLDRPGEVLVISFRIQARLKADGSDREVWFDTVVAASGRVQVQPR